MYCMRKKMQCTFVTLGIVVLLCRVQTAFSDDASQNLEKEEVTFNETIKYGRKDVLKEWERDSAVLAFNRVMVPFFKLIPIMRDIQNNKPDKHSIVQIPLRNLRRKLRNALNITKDAFKDRLKYAMKLEGETDKDVHKLFDNMKHMSKAFVDANKFFKCKENMTEKIEKYELIYSTFALNCEKTSNLLFALVRMPHRKLLYGLNKGIVDAGNSLENCTDTTCYQKAGKTIDEGNKKIQKLIGEARRKENIDKVEMKASKWLFKACAESFMENYGDALKLIKKECPN